MTKEELKQIGDFIQMHTSSPVKQRFAKLWAHIDEQAGLLREQKNLVNNLSSTVQNLKKANNELQAQIERPSTDEEPAYGWNHGNRSDDESSSPAEKSDGN